MADTPDTDRIGLEAIEAVLGEFHGEIVRLRAERDRWKGYAKAQRAGRHRLVPVVLAAEALVDKWHSNTYWDDDALGGALDRAVRAYRDQEEDR